MTFIQILQQNGVFYCFAIWIIVSFLLGLLVGVSVKGRSGKTSEAEEAALPAAEALTVQQADEADSGRLIAVITAAVNEYRKNNI